MDAEGQIVGEHYRGCEGRARASHGHLSRDAVIKAKMVNAGTGVWETEHECQRPTTSGMVYDPVKVQAAVVPADSLVRPTSGVRRALGIDWGRHAVAVFAERHADCVAVCEGKVFESKSITDVLAYAVSLRAKYGNIAVYADSENRYGNIDMQGTGLGVIAVSFAHRKEEGIENVARYLNHGRLKIADTAELKLLIRQMLRLRRNDLGKVVKVDDHGPDALLCAMLHFPFVDEFGSALGELYAGGGSDQRRVTNRVLEACVHDGGPRDGEGRGTTMGVSVASAEYFAVVSTLPAKIGEVRGARFVGRLGSLDELDALRAKYGVRLCVIEAHADPHRIDEWSKRRATGGVVRVDYLNDGLSGPQWDHARRVVTVDRTYLLDAAYDELSGGRWWLMAGADKIDNGEFFAQMKAPKRERDLAAGVERYRWSETVGRDHYRQAQAFDYLASRLLLQNRVRVSTF